MDKDLTKQFPNVLRDIGRIGDQQGVEVYVVGGYIRDLLLTGGIIEHHDFDFTVVGDALSFARAVKNALHGKNLIVYDRFGTALLELNNDKLEFVTARKERYSKNSRKPEIEKANLTSDLSRRDFTINTLSVGLNNETWGQLFDPFHGLQDIHDQVIRTPLDPEMTFEDDPLRILRGIRFATVLKFHIEQKTQAAMKKMAHRLKIVSQERITEELFKMLAASQPSDGFYLMDTLGILPIVFPELEDMKGVEQRKDFHHKDVFNHTMKVLDNASQATDKLPLRLAALLHDIAKPQTKRFDEQTGWTFHGHDEIGARMVENIARRLKIPTRTKEYIQKLIRLHLRPIFLASEEVTDSAIRRLIIQAGDDLDDLITLCRADITSGNPDRVRRHLKNFDFVMKRVREVRENDKLRQFQSPVRGDKIMDVCNIPPGPMVGKLKKAIEEAILDGEIPNDYDAALDYLLKIKDKYLK